MRYWITTRKAQKIATQATFELEHEISLTDLVARGCELLKLPRPLVLTLHEQDFERFGFCTFQRSTFVEDVPFSDLQLRRLVDQDKSFGVVTKNDL